MSTPTTKRSAGASARSSRPAERAPDRLNRLLTMVPWLLSHQGIDLERAADELGVGIEQIRADLDLIFLCGLPGHMPDDLIDVSYDSGQVYVSNADTIDRPLRLGRDEALALIVALRALADGVPTGQRDAVDRALAKLEAAAGDAAVNAADVQVRTDPSAHDEELLNRLDEALKAHRRLHLRYLVAARDESTERDVDPMRLVQVDGHWYLEGWCHRAGDTRLFRVDRIEDLQVLEVDGTPPADAPRRDLGGGAFAPSADGLLVELDLAPSAAWVAEYFVLESAVDRDGGGQRIALRASDPRGLVRLVWRLGGAAVVIAPAHLRAEVAEGARQALAAYGTGD